MAQKFGGLLGVLEQKENNEIHYDMNVVKV
jgi:hypothetical protein